MELIGASFHVPAGQRPGSRPWAPIPFPRRPGDGPRAPFYAPGGLRHLARVLAPTSPMTLPAGPSRVGDVRFGLLFLALAVIALLLLAAQVWPLSGVHRTALVPGVARGHAIAAAREEENVRLLYQAGADLVVTPSVSGGRLMAAAVRQKAVAQFFEDILSFGHGVDCAERVVREDEAGRSVSDLPHLRGALILGVACGAEDYPFHQRANVLLRPGDVVVYLMGNQTCTLEALAT